MSDSNRGWRRRQGSLPSVRAIVDSKEPAQQPISPELVLIDPDIAARARASLPDHPWPKPVRIEPPRRPRRRIPVAAMFSILSFTALVSILGVSVLPTRDQPTFAAERQTIPTAEIPTAAPPPRKKANRPAAPSSQKSTPQPTPRPQPTQRPQPKQKPRVVGRERPRRATPPKRRGKTRFEPARTFAWAARARAAFYRVDLFRNGAPFYHARTRDSQLTLPRRVRFSPGNYRWTVRPAIRHQSGIRLEDPIVDSTFRVGSS
jgi:hypothetical protein